MRGRLLQRKYRRLHIYQAHRICQSPYHSTRFEMKSSSIQGAQSTWSQGKHCMSDTPCCTLIRLYRRGHSCSNGSPSIYRNPSPSVLNIFCTLLPSSCSRMTLYYCSNSTHKKCKYQYQQSRCILSIPYPWPYMNQLRTICNQGDRQWRMLLRQLKNHNQDKRFDFHRTSPS